MLAVVTSAARGTIKESVLDIRCSLYPNIHPLVWLKPHLAFASIPEHGTIPFFMDDACQTLPFDLSKVLSTARIYGLTRSSKTNRFPIVDILSLMSSETVFRRLSKVRLLGRYDTETNHRLSLSFCCLVAR